jgi:hypothetical protein
MEEGEQSATPSAPGSGPGSGLLVGAGEAGVERREAMSGPPSWPFWPSGRCTATR